MNKDRACHSAFSPAFVKPLLVQIAGSGSITAYVRQMPQPSALYSSSQVDEPPPQAWHRHMGFQECGIIAGINEGGVGEVFFRKAL